MAYTTTRLYSCKEALSVDETPSPKHDIVAIGSFYEYCATIWTTMGSHKNSAMWLEELLPDHIGNHRLMVFDYDLGPQAKISPELIESLATSLLEKLLQKSIDSSSSLVFVSHGEGGLIVKQALRIAVHSERYSSIASRVSLLVFFSTPHRASHNDSWRKIAWGLVFASYGKFYKHEAWHERVSEAIEQLPQTMIRVSQEFKAIERIFNILNIFENEIKSDTIPQVVGNYSATFGIFNEKTVARPEKYSDICKIFDSKDVAFKAFCDEVEISFAPNDKYLECIRTLSKTACNSYVPQETFLNPEWIQRRKPYKSWLAKSGGVLSMIGKSGSGVSALASCVVRYRANQQKNDKVISLAVVPGDDMYRSTFKMLTSLIYQLLCLEPDLFQHISLLYGSMLMEGRWSVSKLWNLLRSILSCPHHGTVIIWMDCVEEYDDACISLVNELARLSNSENATLKLIITTNEPSLVPNNSMEINLDNAEILKLRENEFKHGLQTEFSKLMREKPMYHAIESRMKERLQILESKLLEGKTTMLTARLELALLATIPVPSVKYSMKMALETVALPVSDKLNYIFDWHFHQIPESYREIAYNSLSWMILALRPLKLTELAVAVTFKAGLPSITRFTDRVPQDLKSDLECIFKFLIRIENGNVYLIHKHFRDYVKNAHPCGENFPLSCIRLMDHNAVAQTCLNYLSSFRDVSDGHEATKLENRYDHFYDYANEHWPGHYNKAAQSDQLSAALAKFVDDGLENWSEWHDIKQTKETQVRSKYMLTTAIKFGPDDLTNFMLDKLCFDAGILEIALDVAVQRGNEPLICKLHDLGARSSKTLHIASSYGQYQIVETLIKHNTDITTTNSAGLTPLHLACEANCLPMVEALLQRKLDIHAKVKRSEETKALTIGSTPLHIASQFGHIEIMDKLLENGANPTCVDNDGSTPLHLACKWQQPEAVKLLLTRVEDVSVFDNDHRIPLHIACGTGRVEIVDFILRVHSDPLPQHKKSISVSEIIVMRGEQGQTPLHYAAANGHGKVAEKLRSFWGSTLDSDLLRAQDMRGYIPLHLASKNGHLRAVEIILSWGKEYVEVSDHKGLKPIHWAVMERHIEVVKVLCQAHQEFDATLNHSWNDYGLSPLHFACKKGFTEIASLLLKSEADVNVVDRNSNTPLHLATMGGFTGTTQILLQHDANITLTNDGRSTPLHLAAEKGNLKLVKIFLGSFEKLLNSGKFINLKNNLGYSAIMLAVKNGHVDVLKELKSVRVEESDCQELMFLAASSGHAMVIEYLLEQFRLDVNTRDSEKNTPLHLASEAGHLEGVQFLLRKNADLKAVNNEHKSPFELASNSEVALALFNEYTNFSLSVEDKIKILFISTKRGDAEVLKQLLTEHNFNISHTEETSAFEVDEKDEEKCTPLWYAVKEGNASIVRLLLEFGADPNNKDSRDGTVLHIAASYGFGPVMRELLLSKKILDINEPDEYKATPIYLAAFSGYPDIVSCLLQAGAKVNFDFGGPWGWSPLHASYDNCEILIQLLEAEAQINAQNDDGDTTLACAVRNGYQESTEILLEKHADPFILDSEGRTSLHIAANGNDVKILELLLKYALPLGKINSKDQDGKTALHVAAQNSNVNILEMLLRHVSPGDADIKDNSGKTSLMTATLAANVRGVEKILQSGVDVNALDDNKHTSLWYAIEKNSVEITNLLFEKVDLESLPETPKSLYDHAVESENIKALELLWLNVPSKLGGSHERVFKLAASQESIPLINNILQSDNGKDWRDEHGWTLADISEIIQPSYDKRLADPQWKQPSSLSVADKSDLLQLVEKDGLTVRYPDEFKESASIRADHPIPPVGEFYFEVTIVNDGYENSGEIAVGFGYKSADLNCRPGMSQFSWGYHGEDGGLFPWQTEHNDDTNGTYGKDDIIGCCVDPVKRVAYFTRNGKRLDSEFKDIPGGRLFPMVGLASKQAEVRVKFDCKVKHNHESELENN